MSRARTPHPSNDVLEGVSATLVGVGLITMALFPLALPIVALTAVALIPLLLPAIAVGLLVVLVAVPIMLVRSLGTRAYRVLRPRGPAVTGHPPSAEAPQGRRAPTSSAML
jgi:hypothetical protein